ncbi:MAG: VOC family protein [Bacteroidales bacterium]|nr:VOC family protein [Bacteroidales bacterium]MBK9356510.1 VOC family protein [Bacteroidales bacterium]
MENRLQFHHVGTLVENMADAISHYTDLFGPESVSPVIAIGSQQVNVCFVKMANESYIELVESCGEESVVSKMVKKKVTYYHIGYKVDNITSTVSELEQMDYRPMDYFHSEAFEGKRCIFLFSPDMHLIELIEK